jgi:glycosyltransferase involved in cell wall biosynthesis
VIVRCGKQRLRLLRAAVDSIRNQSYGAFTVVLSKFEDVDLSTITGDLSGRIERFIEVSTPGGGRAETLVAGLKEADTEYFAILDDDDFWLSEHIETLFAAGHITDRDFDVAFSGTVCIAAEGTEIETRLFWNRNIYNFGFRHPPSTITQVTGAFASNCFVARTSLLPTDLQSFGVMETAEDSLVVALVTRNKTPVFSYKPTAFFRRGYAGESDWSKSTTRHRDLLSLELRAGMLLSPAWLNIGSASFHETGTIGHLAVPRRLTGRRVAVARRVSAARPVAVAFTRYLIGDGVVLARIVIAAVTGRDHPSARKERLVSPLRALRRNS